MTDDLIEQLARRLQDVMFHPDAKPHEWRVRLARETLRQMEYTRAQTLVRSINDHPYGFSNDELVRPLALAPPDWTPK